jgi:hypothetical protein
MKTEQVLDEMREEELQAETYLYLYLCLCLYASMKLD